MSHRSSLTLKLLPALLALVILASLEPLQAQAQGLTQTFVLLTQPDHEAMSQLQAAVEAGGGRLTHTFPYQAAIAELPAEAVPSLATLPSVAAIFTGPVDLAAIEMYGPEARRLAGVWNNLLVPASAKTVMAEAHEEAHQDALLPPDLSLQLRSLPSDSVTPGYYQTSEFMAGSVAVGIVLVESNGRIDPSTENWTLDEKQTVFSEIVAGLQWWAGLEPNAGLTFVYDDHFSQPVPTGVEPIQRPYRDQQYWIAEAMAALGHPGSSYFTQVRDFTNALRETYGTDWAFTIFVVDSEADLDNRFSDGYFAYAYLGGPFMVLTSENNGYGADNMDAVAAHEMGHIFQALDQYQEAHQSCTRRSGYLNIENQNSQYGGCQSDTFSIMRGQILPYTIKVIDPYAAGQIGWRDSDGDQILDPLDTPLPVNLTEVSQQNNQVTIQGEAEVVPYPSPNRSSLTINSLTGVQYRLNGGNWQSVAALDGHFDSMSETFRFTFTLPSSGEYTLEVAATDSAGNVSAPYASAALMLLDPLDGGLNTELYTPSGVASAHLTLSLKGAAYDLQKGQIVGVEYRIDGGAWRPARADDGAFDTHHEAFTIAFEAEGLSTGSHQVEARAIGAGGKVESNVASREVEVAPQFSLWLPLIAESK
jgi:hypothetical protein